MRNILLASYGGGHAEIISAIASELIRRGQRPKVVGFTTAYQRFKSQGIPAESIEALIDKNEDIPYLDGATQYLPEENHPSISHEQSKAYFALGLRDLVHSYGWEKAVSLLNNQGRKAFLPVESMKRYLEKIGPDIVVSTTSPRFELAMHKAARQLGIPSLAVADLFIQDERAWILKSDYAPYLAVICQQVADEVVAGGFEKGNVRVTGNPAFDSLAKKSTDISLRNSLRARLGLTGKTVVLWPGPGGKISNVGRPFCTPEEFVDAMEPVCRRNSNFRYLMRPHPNMPFSLPKNSEHGLLDDRKLLPEEAILIADVVCFDISTMGLQAALRGLPSISVGFGDYQPFGKYGLTSVAETIEEAVLLIERDEISPSPKFQMPPLGSACENVLNFIDDILS